MSESDQPPTIDPIAAKRWSNFSFESSPWLHEEVARRMQERLHYIVRKPSSWLHWHPLSGGMNAHSLIANQYSDAQAYVVQSTEQGRQIAQKKLTDPLWKFSRWRRAQPLFSLPATPVEMLWSNMSLHMESDPVGLIKTWHDLLAVNGFLMFSCLGPDTLLEFRDMYRTLGWPAPTHEFTDMHDWGDMLVNAGFAEPVMDMELITLSFAAPERLLLELRELGRNLHPERFAGLRGRKWRELLLQEITSRCKNSEGQFQLTFEIIYGHSFRPQDRFPVQAESQISLSSMRDALRNKPKP